MGWDKGGRYYTRSRRVNGRVVREHIGGGTIGELASQLDAIERQNRTAKRDVERAEAKMIVDLDATLTELDEFANLLTRAALFAAGYHQHNRGTWRKRRVRQETD
jgi:hypothetical protein